MLTGTSLGFGHTAADLEIAKTNFPFSDSGHFIQKPRGVIE